MKIWSMKNIKDKERDRIYGRGELQGTAARKRRQVLCAVDEWVIGTDYYAPVKAYICFGLCHKRNAPEDFAKNPGA